MSQTQSTINTGHAMLRKDGNFLQRAMFHIWQDRFLWALVLPGLVYFVIFCYVPLGGIVIAFKDYRPRLGIWASPWVGFRYFKEFFNSPYFYRLLRNTIVINVYNLLWGFPVPMVFALLLNEVRAGLFKRTVQTVSYMPHFLSTVVIVGLIQSFLNPYEGIFNILLNKMGNESITFLNQPKYFRTIYVASGIWQSFGYNSIIYLSAISAVDPQMYEAARIDGASRMQIMTRITLPCIMPTAIILLILQFGRMMNIGFEKVNLLQNPATYETSDVISTYVYRKGIQDAQYSFSTAISVFNSAINLMLISVVNFISRRMSDISLW
jgi:putative aldouronate transport system permease protein